MRYKLCKSCDVTSSHVESMRGLGFMFDKKGGGSKEILDYSDGVTKWEKDGDDVKINGVVLKDIKECIIMKKTKRGVICAFNKERNDYVISHIRDGHIDIWGVIKAEREFVHRPRGEMILCGHGYKIYKKIRET